MTGVRRWQDAQEYEKEYWRNIANTIMADSEKQLTWYGWKANELEKRLVNMDNKLDKGNCRVLEVGSGPIGIVSYLEWGNKYALDPLADFYGENSHLVALRNPGVNYITGTGEDIPFPDKHFSFVIIDNVLDHVRSPDLVLDQISRVLAEEGLLYIELNVHAPWGCMLHSLLSKMNIDKGHPHSYTPNRIRYRLCQHRFSILSEVIQDYRKARDSDRSSFSMKSKVKGYTGLSEFIYSAICQKS